MVPSRAAREDVRLWRRVTHAGRMKEVTEQAETEHRTNAAA